MRSKGAMNILMNWRQGTYYRMENRAHKIVTYSVQCSTIQQKPTNGSKFFGGKKC